MGGWGGVVVLLAGGCGFEVVLFHIYWHCKDVVQVLAIKEIIIFLSDLYIV